MPDIKYKKGLPWLAPLTQKMIQFREETGKNPVFHGKITGQFEYWMYWRKPKVKKQTTKRKPGRKPTPKTKLKLIEKKKGRKTTKIYISETITDEEREQIYYKIKELINKNNDNIYKWHMTLEELNRNRAWFLESDNKYNVKSEIKKRIKELREDLEFWADKRDKINVKITGLAKRGNFDLKYAKDPYGGTKAYHIKGIKPTFYYESVKLQKKFDLAIFEGVVDKARELMDTYSKKAGLSTSYFYLDILLFLRITLIY